MKNKNHSQPRVNDDGHEEHDRRIRKPEVLNLTGYKDRTLYRRIAAGNFPAPVKDGRMSFWWLNQVQRCIGIKSTQGGQPA